MTRYLIMSCEFILTVHLMINMSCPKQSHWRIEGGGQGPLAPPPKKNG